MQIRHIKLCNFRCFEQIDLTLDTSFTLLLGDNGSGKTALIEALRIAAGAFLLGTDVRRVPNIQRTDIRESITPDNLGSVVEPPEVQVFEPVVIDAVGIVNSKPVQWTRTQRGKSSQLRGIVEGLVRERKEGGKPVLPLLAYYPAKRVAKQRIDSIERTVPPARWERGYEGAFDAELNQATQLRWLRSTTFSELQQGMTSPLLVSALDVVANCLEGYFRVQYSVQLEELVAIDEFGRQHRARLLSEGYWTMLMMILDMAFRCATLNPHLGEEVLKQTPGIVLIDELDLHLHPRWQNHVIDDLRASFPRVQFIASTHSPLIGASLPSSCLYHLETNEEGWCQARQYQENTLGLSANQMLTGSYFDLISDRPLAAEHEIDRLSQRVSEGDTDAALELLRKLNNGLEVSSRYSDK